MCEQQRTEDHTHNHYAAPSHAQVVLYFPAKLHDKSAEANEVLYLVISFLLGVCVCDIRVDWVGKDAECQQRY